VTTNGLCALQTSECPKSHITRFHIYSHLWREQKDEIKRVVLLLQKLLSEKPSRERNIRSDVIMFQSRNNMFLLFPFTQL